MIRRIINRLRPPRVSEAQQLINDAVSFPRYTEHEFKFGNYILKVSDFISVAYQLKEYFQDERLKFKCTTTSPVILDCGSNVGVSVLYFKSLYPNAKITAFEPDPAIFSYLTENLARNNIKDVSLVNKAIWINHEGIEFGSEGADGGSVFFEGNKKLLPSVRLKKLMQEETSIDLLKMDIEGAEVDVILDCAEELKKVKYLFIEYHSWVKNPQRLGQLLELLTGNGFRYYINSIGHHSDSPFISVETGNAMDVQLDIYAVNDANKDSTI